MSDQEVRAKDIDVNAIRSKLKNGFVRLTETEVPLSWSWFPVSPHIGEQLQSDYGVEFDEKGDGPRSVASQRKIAREFREEVDAIEVWMKETGLDAGLAQWQKQSDLPSAERLFRGMNLKAQALQVWDWYGIPLRFRGSYVYRIWAPRDLYGSPIIKALPVPVFVTAMAEKSAQDVANTAELSKKLERWKLAFLLLAGGVILALLIWLS